MNRLHVETPIRQPSPDARYSLILVLLLCLPKYGVAQTTQSRGSTESPVVIRGRIVDQDGKPVAQATIGQNWTRVFFSFTPVPEPAETGRDGVFEFKPILPIQKNALFAMDRSRTSGAVLVFDPASPREEYTVRLVPLVKVTVPFDKSALPPDAVPTASIAVEGCAVPIVLEHVATSKLRFMLPPGQYRMSISGDTCVELTQHLVVPAGVSEMSVEPIALERGALATYMHRELPPWHVTDARGLPKDVKLSDFRGKWVIVEFWGYWCGPCVRFGIPDLVRFQEEYSEYADQFAIVTFHAPDVPDTATLEKQLKRLERTIWGGKSLPFPVLLDSTKKTVTAWEVRSYPTTFIIAPDGRLVYARSGAGPGHSIAAVMAGRLRRPGAASSADTGVSQSGQKQQRKEKKVWTHEKH